MKVGVIDYGVGNLASVIRSLEQLGVAPSLVEHAVDVGSSDALILPGVGSFSKCIELLRSGGWVEPLEQAVLGYGRPLLGICLGMQLLAESSAEGATIEEDTVGLGFIPGRVRHLRALGCNLRIPHVGWNGVSRTKVANNTLFDQIPDDTDFYFVHSYAFEARNESDVLAEVDYGVPIVAAVRSGRIWGTQFHPEKSSKAGLRILRNFVES
jgi:glutamine amidotransferase